MDAQDLEEEFDSLEGIQISVFLNDRKYEIDMVDFFTDGVEQRLHSIDLNLNKGEYI